MAKAKQTTMRRKVPNDGYIAPRDPADVLQNPSGSEPLPDPQAVPVPPAADPHVVKPPALGPDPTQPLTP